MPTKFTPLKASDQRNRSGDRILVLSKANDLLMALSGHPDGLSLREISLYVKLPRSTVRRILETMEEHNWVITAPSTTTYRLGPTLAWLASNIRPFDIGKSARPILMQLAERTDESAYLCVVAHGMAVVVDLIPGSYPLHTVATMGTSLPLYATACGKALLATLSDEELGILRDQLKLQPLTKNTKTDWDLLLAEIETIRETGVAIDQEEYQPGICGIAIPLRGPSGELGTISIPMPTERFRTIGESLIQQLLQATQALRWSR
ncbi:MAG: transcriptional regulator, IclR family protein [Holophagaceae bacterium]|nr:transcriptional regulator, IclR family protein [Holophagaceae bacterium]